MREKAMANNLINAKTIHVQGLLIRTEKPFLPSQGPANDRSANRGTDRSSRGRGNSPDARGTHSEGRSRSPVARMETPPAAAPRALPSATAHASQSTLQLIARLRAQAEGLASATEPAVELQQVYVSVAVLEVARALLSCPTAQSSSDAQALSQIARAAGLKRVGDTYEAPENGDRVAVSGLLSFCEAVQRRIEGNRASC